MKRIEVSERFIEVIVDTLAVDPEECVESARFKEDIPMDSLDVIELMVATEEEFGITINDSDVEGVETINDAINAIRSKL